MKSEIIKIAKDNLADIIGFASADTFDKNDAIFKIFPNTKTVICLAFRVLRGIYRGIEEAQPIISIRPWLLKIWKKQ